ncbi:hybrid sensor histidine kinase/response regulator [soil metagenome]
MTPDELSADRAVATCLLVDDRPENLLALRALLRAPDVEVLEARSGPDALELLLLHDVALVLLDVQMPGMDGFEVAELMRGSERTRHVPIIFITAGSHDQARVFKGYDTGAVDYLHKPVDPGVLRNKAGVFFELHRQRQQLAINLRERDKALHLNEMFMAVLGHDLRSPLAAISMGAELIERQPDPVHVLDIARRILSSAGRMEQMIGDLLDVARSRLGGGLPLQPVVTDLRDLVERAVQEQQMRFPDRDITLHATGDCKGEWDAGRLLQMVNNLLGNAIEHGSEGFPIAVDLDGTATDRVLVSISNHGLIPEHMRESMFDPFRRGNTSTGPQGGLGLGLYIAQQIALAHGGELRLVSTDAGQTVATVQFPRRRQAARTA